MKIQYLTKVSSIAELKKTYQKLCFKHHPDRGGNTETMQIINAEYDFLLKNLIDQEEESEYSEEKFWQSKEQQTEVEQVIHAKIQEIIGANLEGIKIEIIGVWIWLSGDTKAHKEKSLQPGPKHCDAVAGSSKSLHRYPQQWVNNVKHLKPQGEIMLM